MASVIRRIDYATRLSENPARNSSLSRKTPLDSRLLKDKRKRADPVTGIGPSIEN